MLCTELLHGSAAQMHHSAAVERLGPFQQFGHLTVSGKKTPLVTALQCLQCLLQEQAVARRSTAVHHEGPTTVITEWHLVGFSLVLPSPFLPQLVSFLRIVVICVR